MPSVADIQPYVQLTRPQNVSGSVITYCIGYFFAIHTLSPDFFVGLIILLALHSLATLQNDIEDFEIDKANKRQSVLQDHHLSISGAKFFVQALVLMAVVFALLSSHRRIHLTVILGLLLVAWLYNLNPIRASKKPIASILIMGLCYGALPFIYGYLVASGKPLSATFLLLAILFFLARISTAIMKDYKDVKGDKLFNKKTFYLRYGANLTAWTSFITAVIAYIGIIGMLLLRSRTVALFVTLLLVIILALRSTMLRLALTKTKNEKKLNVIFHKSVFGHNQFEAAVLLCLILSSK